MMVTVHHRHHRCHHHHRLFLPSLLTPRKAAAQNTAWCPASAHLDKRAETLKCRGVARPLLGMVACCVGDGAGGCGCCIGRPYAEPVAPLFVVDPCTP